MNFVGNEQIAQWYGPPCEQPITSVQVAGSPININGKAKRLFQFQDLAFQVLTPAYYEDLSERHLDDWGYICRPVTGGSGPVTLQNASKHAWGLASDIDADENVRGVHEFDTEIWLKGKRAVMVLEEAGFTWGGRFSTPDAHHFEVAQPQDWITARFDLKGRPVPWFAQKLEWPGPVANPD